MLTKTSALAHFLRTTGPASSSSSPSQPGTGTHLFNRPSSFRTNTSAKTTTKHIPLLVCYPPTNPHEQKAEPEPRSCFTASTDSLSQQSTSGNHCDDPQQQQPEKPRTHVLCPYCQSPATTSKRTRRMSCPGAIHYSPAKTPQLTSKEAKALLSMIEKLQAQLAKEQASRRALELALENQQ